MNCGNSREPQAIIDFRWLACMPKLLGMDNAVELLHTTLDEEKQIDDKLTQIASEINLVAQTQAAG